MTTKASKDYSQGKIYKIEPTVEHDEGDIYIGSTTKKYLSQRMTAHKSGYYQWKEGKRNTTSSYILFDNYGFENCQIVLLEIVHASNYDDLASREAHYIRTTTCINSNIPLRTDTEYYQDNKDKIRKYYNDNRDKILQYHKQYDTENKEKICKYRQEYYEKNKEKINEQKKLYNQSHKEILGKSKKEYYNSNKESIREYKKKYAEDNKDKIREYKRQYYLKQKSEDK